MQVYLVKKRGDGKSDEAGKRWDKKAGVVDTPAVVFNSS